MWLDKQLIFVDLEVNSREEVLTLLGSRLFDLGYVKSNFTTSVLEREEGFPTSPYGIAIPHTDGDKVIQSKLVFASLKRPVQFMKMGCSKEEMQVSLVIMMAIEDGYDQTQMLQQLMKTFQNKVLVSQLKRLQRDEKIMEILDPF